MDRPNTLSGWPVPNNRARTPRHRRGGDRQQPPRPVLEAARVEEVGDPVVVLDGSQEPFHGPCLPLVRRGVAPAGGDEEAGLAAATDRVAVAAGVAIDPLVVAAAAASSPAAEVAAAIVRAGPAGSRRRGRDVGEASGVWAHAIYGSPTPQARSDRRGSPVAPPWHLPSAPDAPARRARAPGNWSTQPFPLPAHARAQACRPAYG